MDFFLKIISCLMLAVLLTTQLLLTSPYREKMVDASRSGRVLKTYETLIYKGSLTLNVVGEYTPNSAAILINGETQRIVDSFPVGLDVCDGDILEIQLKMGIPSFYVYLTDIKGQIKTDGKESTFLVEPGVNRIVKVLGVAQPED